LVWVLLSLPFLAIAWRITTSREPAPVLDAPSKKLLEAPPMCPWRQPEKDLKTFFPGATHYRIETLIFTRKFREVKARLGRLPAPEENPLHLHRIYQHQQPVGSVITRRVKGEYGAIEIVLAIKQGTVAGLHIQRMREPQPIAQALNSANWQRSFVGKTSRNGWQPGRDVPSVQPEARNSAQAIIQAVRTLLILHEISES
jgi:hypothetical protein